MNTGWNGDAIKFRGNHKPQTEWMDLFNLEFSKAHLSFDQLGDFGFTFP